MKPLNIQEDDQDVVFNLILVKILKKILKKNSCYIKVKSKKFRA